MKHCSATDVESEGALAIHIATPTSQRQYHICRPSARYAHVHTCRACALSASTNCNMSHHTKKTCAARDQLLFYLRQKMFSCIRQWPRHLETCFAVARCAAVEASQRERTKGLRKQKSRFLFPSKVKNKQRKPRASECENSTCLFTPQPS